MSDSWYSQRELVAGELIGWRLFRVANDKVLAGPYTFLAWQPGKNTAECVRLETFMKPLPMSVTPLEWSATSELEVSATPSFEKVTVRRCLGYIDQICNCGFYGRTVLSPNDFELWKNPHRYHVVGAIRAWGKIVAGTLGFRAEFAEILGFYHAQTAEMDLNIIADAYNVPWYLSAATFAKKHPMTRMPS